MSGVMSSSSPKLCDVFLLLSPLCFFCVILGGSLRRVEAGSAKPKSRRPRERHQLCERGLGGNWSDLPGAFSQSFLAKRQDALEGSQSTRIDYCHDKNSNKVDAGGAGGGRVRESALSRVKALKTVKKIALKNSKTGAYLPLALFGQTCALKFKNYKSILHYV